MSISKELRRLADRLDNGEIEADFFSTSIGCYHDQSPEQDDPIDKVHIYNTNGQFITTLNWHRKDNNETFEV